MLHANTGALQIQKIHGTGNDFLFIDARLPLAGRFANVERGELARRLCGRRLGVGADGLVFIETSNLPAQIKWDFYNNDGSHAEMCGNASRCVGRWAQRNMGVDSVELETVPGPVRIEIEGEKVRSHLNYILIKFTDVEFASDGQKKRATLVGTGVPHFVVETDSVETSRISCDVIQKLRFHEAAGARGANVTFLRRLGANSEGIDFSTVTFERGVEDFTLSCGTGVLAAAAVGLRGGDKLGATLRTPGGILRVIFGERWVGAALEGPAVPVLSGSVGEEILR